MAKSVYSPAFEAAIDHAMLYEVGGFWSASHPAVPGGLIDTKENRKAVGYVNDPMDRGGETKFGVAQNANHDIDITFLTWDQAKAIYNVRYWIAGKCDRLLPRVAVLHFDGCVNHGVKKANMFLQKAVGTVADGYVGPVTIAAANAMNPMDLCHSICDQRTAFYKQIVENNSTQAKYLNGWLRRINEMRAFTTDPNSDFV
jgi:lysozyme family protein